MWWSIGILVVIAVGALVLVSRGGEKTNKTEEPATSRAIFPRSSARDSAAGEDSPQTPSRRPSSKSARRQQRERERAAELERLHRELTPSKVKLEVQWSEVKKLIREAERLVGVERGDGREAVSGSDEAKRQAKLKAEKVRRLLRSNEVFRLLSVDFSDVLIDAPEYDFFTDWINRNNGLLMKLKGVRT